MYPYNITRFRGELAVVWYDKNEDRHRHTLGTVDRGVAEALARKAVLTAYNVDHLTVVKTISNYVADYFKQSDMIGIKTMRCHWSYAEPFFGKMLPQHVTSDICKAYAAQRVRKPRAGAEGTPEAVVLSRNAKPISPSTLSKEIGIVRAALAVANKEHEASFWFPSQRQPRDVRMKRPEFDRLANQMEFNHLLLFLIVARYTAGRTGAILELKWEQIDFDMRRINLRHTGRQKRRGLVPMHPNLAWALALAKSISMSDYVIEYAGGPVGSIKKGFAAAVARAGLPKTYTPHVLRHTSASWMAEAGIRMEVIAQFLGHTNSKITERIYARFSPDFMADAVAALG